MAKTKRIGILTAGGDSPGLNAAVALVKLRSGFMAWRFLDFATAFAASSKTGG